MNLISKAELKELWLASKCRAYVAIALGYARGWRACEAHNKQSENPMSMMLCKHGCQVGVVGMQVFRCEECKAEATGLPRGTPLPILMDVLAEGTLIRPGEPTYLELKAKLAAAQSRITELEQLSVTRIMLGVQPGEGDGVEVYAKSVDEVVKKLSDLGLDFETMQDALKYIAYEKKRGSVWQRTAAKEALNNLESYGG